jgi:beta-lysine 5,6-aminomutase beta subunit
VTRQPIRAYGDRKDDGRVQLSFTLPVPCSGKAREAARQFCVALGLSNVLIAQAEPAGRDFTFFVAYGSADVTLDYAAIEVPEVTVPAWSAKEINHLIEERLRRKVVVVGACTGSDAHTVGIDAILNMKGFAGDKGLEAYPFIDAHNLGAQVDNLALLTRARELDADAILVSQVMTQRDLHVENSTQLIQLAKKQGMRDRLFLLGGPRIDHKLARELGYDAGFGPGTKPSQVASYIVDSLIKRSGGRSG